MASDVIDVKERILNATVKLLIDKKDADKITVREIAKIANVNIALINYHFQSKENLINQAVEICMVDIAEKSADITLEEGSVNKIKSIIKNNSTFAFQFYHLAKITVSSALKNGNVGTVQTILPLLKSIYGDKKSETELKLIALQLLIPLQVIFLNPNDYKNYLQINIYDEHQRNELIDKLIDNILKGGN